MRAGMDEETGKLLLGWSHVEMIIRRCLTTRTGSLILRRRIGSNLKKLIDENMNAATILKAYTAIAEALSPLNPYWGEPSFRLRSIKLAGLSANGVLGLVLLGDYYPNGHLGDYSQKEQVSTTILAKEI